MQLSQPSPHDPFQDPVLKDLFKSPELRAENFDSTVLQNDERLRAVYFWGVDCPNCAVAKTQMKAISDKLKAMPVDFFAVNAYDNMDLATRFGLYGIPVYLFFKRGRLLGRITSFPTQDEFLAAVARLT